MLTPARTWGIAIGLFLAAPGLFLMLTMGECLLDVPSLCPIPQHVRAAAWVVGVAAGAVLGFMYACVGEQLLAPWRAPTRRRTTAMVLGFVGGLGWPGALAMTFAGLLLDAHSDPSKGYERLAIGSGIATVVLLVAFIAGVALLLLEQDTDVEGPSATPPRAPTRQAG